MDLTTLHNAYIAAQRSIAADKARADTSRHAVRAVEPTLGDRIRADRDEPNPFLLCNCLPGFAGTHQPTCAYVKALYSRS